MKKKRNNPCFWVNSNDSILRNFGILQKILRKIKQLHEKKI